MRVLHYIPTLAKSMRQAGKPAQVLHMALCTKIYSQMFTGSAVSKDFINCLRKTRPDVLHIHGCWNVNTAVACLLAEHYGIPVVISPHGMLAQDVIQQDFWKKLPRMLTYQMRTIRHSFVLHASSEQEEKDLKSLGWKKRISLITISKNEWEQPLMVDRFAALYKKVIDTVQRNKLNEVETTCFWALLYADVASEHEAIINNVSAAEFTKLTPENWKAIQVYAIDHGVLDNITHGAQMLSITISLPVREAPSRYPAKSILKESTRLDDFEQITATYSNSPRELALAFEVHELYKVADKLLVSKKCPYPLVSLLSIYETMQWSEYDERIFAEIIEKMGITSFCGRIMQILAERFSLSLGYMPVDPVDDRHKRKIINNLNNLP